MEKLNIADLETVAGGIFDWGDQSKKTTNNYDYSSYSKSDWSYKGATTTLSGNYGQFGVTASNGGENSNTVIGNGSTSGDFSQGQQNF